MHTHKTYFPASHLVAGIGNKCPTCFSGFQQAFETLFSYFAEAILGVRLGPSSEGCLQNH